MGLSTNKIANWYHIKRIINKLIILKFCIGGDVILS